MPDINVARSLTYIGPRKALLLCMVWDVGFQLGQTAGAPDTWRRRGMRQRLFMRQAGLMCMGRKAMHPEDHWSFALWPVENSPVDAAFRRRSPAGSEEFEFVQLKEFVPDDVNPRQSLQSLLDRLGERYPEAGGFTIGINVNRDATTNLGQLRMPPLRNGSIWLFGVGGEAPFDCFLLGDLLRSGEFTGCFFMHPRFQAGESPLSLANVSD